MPVDFLAVAQAGQNLIPDIRQQLMQDDERRARNEQRTVLNEQRRVATQVAQEKQARLKQLQTGLNEAVLSNKPHAITRLMTQFPEYADQIKPGWEALRNEERQTNQTQVGSAYVRGQNGDYKGAAAIMEERYNADLQAGHADPHTKELLDELKSNDPQRQRIAVSTLGIYLAADDPDKFAQLYPDMQREARLQELQPYEIARKQAEAEAAPGYYDARADKERHQAATAASNARYADAKNAAVIDRAGATAANARSLADRRNAAPPVQIGSGGSSTTRPARQKSRGPEGDRCHRRSRQPHSAQSENEAVGAVLIGLFKLVGQLMAGEDADWSDWMDDQIVPDVRPDPPVMPPSPTLQRDRYLVLHTYFGAPETMH